MGTCFIHQLDPYVITLEYGMFGHYRGHRKSLPSYRCLLGVVWTMLFAPDDLSRTPA